MKILVIHATAGAGHRKAAEALYNSLKETTAFEVAIVDVLDYTSPFYKKLYRETYSFLIAKMPWLWGFSFVALDIPCLLPIVQKVRRFYNSLNARPLVRYLQAENFDYILSTHFFPNEVTAALKRKGLIRSKIISMVTDFDVHRIWLAEGIDHYAVASEWTKEKLKSLGVEEGKILVSGIPTDKKFAMTRNKKELRQRLSLREDLFTVLVATGSFGMGPIEEIIDSLREFQVIVVCGHNKNLYARLNQKNLKNVRACGLVDNMDELMAASDAMVTKPGGLSISEALVSHLPLIFFSAIPGQETNNVRVLKEYGVGISDCTAAEIAATLKKYSSSPDEYTAAIEKIKVLARPSAVEDIKSLIS
ncbi:MAG: glycosyltransferase [Candidatus Omnitrophota bacterium]